ncbi:MAG: hypothetical protein ACTSSH_05165, partial [Candidatus Heimdallarchaeota archaeon]
MTLYDTWPKELLIHYHRLEDNFRSFISTYIAKIASAGNDPLINFITGIDQLADTEGIITSNSEFLFLAANIYSIQGKYERVTEICNKDEMHP